MDLGSNHRRHAPMEPPLTSAEAFTHALAARHRVVLLGGMAIISHGLNRKTKDVDIWLEPLPAAAEWAAVLNECLSSFSEVYPWSLAERRVLMPDEVAEEIEDAGLVRVGGFDRDIDVFRRPNELGIESFEEVWERSVKVLEGGIRLPDPLDLHISKANTGREHDWKDQLFLESLVKARFKERLPVCIWRRQHPCWTASWTRRRCNTHGKILTPRCARWCSNTCVSSRPKEIRTHAIFWPLAAGKTEAGTRRRRREFYPGRRVK